MPRIYILNIGFDNVTPGAALDIITGMIERGERGYVVTPNPEIVYACRSDPELEKIMNGAALSVADGVGIVQAARITGTPVKARIPGADLAETLVEWMSGHGKSIYLLGAAPGIAETAAANLQAKYPGLIVAGTHDGFFKDAAPVIEGIKAARPNAVIVGMGSPLQERFMARYINELEPCVMLGLGGSIDVYAGAVKRAPRLWRKCGFEWLYRLIQEPKRIKRMKKIPLFLGLVIRERIKHVRKGV